MSVESPLLATCGVGAELVGVRHDAGLVGVGWNQAGGEKEIVKSWEKWEAMLKINRRRCDGRHPIPGWLRICVPVLRFAAVMSLLWLVDLEIACFIVDCLCLCHFWARSGQVNENDE